jgi:hypothetical protein
LLKNRLEVLDVLGEQPPSLRCGEGDYFLVRHGPDARLLSHGGDVVFEVTQAAAMTGENISSRSSLAGAGWFMR